MWTTIGARLLNLFFRNLVCMSAFYNAFALVGGMYWDTLTCGLWYWALDHTSSYVYSDTGARLIIWELMCKSSTFTFFLVGGGCDTTLGAGLLVWWFCGFSVDSWVAVGARLLIYREMMCMRVPVILPLILSAVDMVLVYRLACGVGL